MKKLLLTLSLGIIFPFSISAQTTLKGYVTLQNSNSKSAYPAQVKAYGASDTDVSKEDGRFELIFDYKRPGQDVSLEVIRAGYEVVNRNDLYHRLPEDKTKQRPLKIYLCPIGQWQQYADKYFEVNLSLINQSYKKKLTNLQQKLELAQIESNDYRQLAAQLDEDRKKAESQAHELAEKFAKANLDDATDRFVLAHRLFTEGKIDSVLVILDEKEMKLDLKAAKKDIDEGKELIELGEDKVLNGQEAKEKVVEEFMIKARAHIIKLEWDAADNSYQLAVEADSTNFGNWLEYAHYLQQQNQFDVTQSLYEIALNLAKTNLDSAKIFHNLAVLSMTQNEFLNAQNYFLRSLKLYEQLEQKDLRHFAYFKALTTKGLASLYKSQNNFKKSQSNYLRALDIMKKLAKENPNYYGRYLAEMFDDLGSLYIKNNDFINAKINYSKALKIYERLAKGNRHIIEPALANTLNNLGLLYKAENDFLNAQNAILEALEICERHAKENPRTFGPGLAKILHNLADIYLIRKESKNAKITYLKALKIKEQLAKENPNAFEPSLAITLNSLSILSTEINDFDNALVFFLRTLEINRRLAEKNPSAFEPSLALNLNNLGILYFKIDDFNNALNTYLEAHNIYKRLSQENPENFDPELAKLLYNIANLYSAQNDFENAKINYLKALKINKRLAKKNPNAFEVDLAATLNNLAKLYSDHNDFNNAQINYSKVIEIRERLAHKKPMIYNLDLCHSYLSFSAYCLKRLQDSQDDYWQKKGMQYLMEAFVIISVYPEDFEPRIRSMNRMNTLYRELSNYPPVLSPYNDSLIMHKNTLLAEEKEQDKIKPQLAIIEIYKKVLKDYPNDEAIQKYLADSYGKLAWYILFSKDFHEAEEIARKAIETHPDAVWVNTNLALALLYQGEYEEAYKIYAEYQGKPYNKNRNWTEVFLEDLATLEAKGISHPDVVKIRTFLKD